MSRLLVHSLLAFGLPMLVAGQTHPNWSPGQVESQALGAPLEYRVFLPATYEREPNERYPVIFWLHGLGGNPASAAPVVEELADAISDGRVPPAILISCSDVTSRSMWTDAKDGSLPIETAIVRELVPHIDETYRTRASRQFRAIEGFSMGGYGAAYLGFKYPELFGSVSILSGALHTGESLKAGRREIFDAVDGGDIAYAEKHSPWTVVRDNADRIRGTTHVRIHVGADDGLLERNESYHELLKELGIDHEWSIVPGAPHNLAILLENWQGDPLAFYANAFNHIPRDDVRVGRVSITSSETLTHPFPEILYVDEGELDWLQAKEHFTAPTGTVVLAPAGTAHTLRSTSVEKATLVFYRWAPGGEQATLHRPSTMIEPVAVPPTVTRGVLNLRRYQSGPAASKRVHAHIDDIDWTTNWTYSEELWNVYRYKPLVREAFAEWRGIARSDVRMGLQELDAHAAYPAHHHPSPEIYVVLSGEARWTVGERSFAAGPGSIVYTPPDTTHRIANTGASRLRWLYFWWAPDGDVSVFE